MALAAHCTCMVGLGETCSHVGAVLFAIMTAVLLRESQSVTEKPVYWLLPSGQPVVMAARLTVHSPPSSVQSAGLGTLPSPIGPLPRRPPGSSPRASLLPWFPVPPAPLSQSPRFPVPVFPRRPPLPHPHSLTPFSPFNKACSSQVLCLGPLCPHIITQPKEKYLEVENIDFHSKATIKHRLDTTFSEGKPIQHKDKQKLRDVSRC